MSWHTTQSCQAAFRDPECGTLQLVCRCLGHSAPRKLGAAHKTLASFQPRFCRSFNILWSVRNLPFVGQDGPGKLGCPAKWNGAGGGRGANQHRAACNPNGDSCSGRLMSLSGRRFSARFSLDLRPNPTPVTTLNNDLKNDRTTFTMTLNTTLKTTSQKTERPSKLPSKRP